MGRRAWQGLGFLTVLMFMLIVACGIVCAYFGPHEIDYYYLTTDDAKRGSCVAAHWTWHTDATVFCSDEPKLVLQYLIVANEQLQLRRKAPPTIIEITPDERNDTTENKQVPKPN